MTEAPSISAPPVAHRVGKTPVRLASIGLRCGALLVDYILTMLIPALTVLSAMWIKRQWDASEAANVVLIFGYLMTGTMLGFNLVYLPGRHGQTIGKRFIGIRIVRTDGRRLDYRALALRHLVGYPLALLCFGLGMLWVIWDAKQQGWHDKLTGTLVVKE